MWGVITWIVVGWVCFTCWLLVVLGATIYKYGVTIATIIIGLLMLIMAQAGPDNTCADAGHTQRAAILFLGSRDALVSSLDPTSPGPLGRLVAGEVSIQLAVHSAWWGTFSSTAADRPRDAHRFFSTHSRFISSLPRIIIVCLFSCPSF